MRTRSRIVPVFVDIAFWWFAKLVRSDRSDVGVITISFPEDAYRLPKPTRSTSLAHRPAPKDRKSLESWWGVRQQGTVDIEKC